MADTQRTEAQLITLFTPSSEDKISAQDMRDYIVSVFGYFTLMIGGVLDINDSPIVLDFNNCAVCLDF